MTAGAAPSIWLLVGTKPGDNAQVRAVSEAVALPATEKRLVMRPQWDLGKPRFRPTLAHLDLERSDPLAPPWPDLVITVGRRPSMAALWIQRQSRGRTRLVVVGRPKRWPDRFALIVAPPQFRVPPGANVVNLALPPIRPDMAKVEAAAAAWRDHLDAMARPLTAVMVGGQTQPFRFDAAAARDLAARLEDLVARDGGSLYVTTSRRTGAAVADVLARRLPQGSRLYCWRPDDAAGNPYQALLGLADRFVVTGDSISMQVEAVRMRKPLAIHPLPLGEGPVAALGRRFAHALGPEGALAGLGEFARRVGLGGYVRDLAVFHDRLYGMGLAVPLGEPFRPPETIDLADDLAPVGARIRRLVQASAAPE